MFVEKWKNSVFKAPSGRPVCFEKVNRTIMILLNKWLYFLNKSNWNTNLNLQTI
jgi:hypothetical protein